MSATEQAPTTRSAFASTTLAVSRVFYAVGIIGIGVQHFIVANFIPVILPSFPAWPPGRLCWVWGIGAFLVVAGVATICPRTSRRAATILGVVLLAFLVWRHISDQLAAPRSLAAWTNAFKILTLAGGAFVVAASAPGAKSGFVSRCFLAFGTFAFGVTCVVFGIDHFLYAQFVAQLVPTWIPGHLFWTYFCGGALIAAGIGMMTPFLPRLAAGLLGATIFSWLILLHIPRALADPHGQLGNEITSVFEALAFSGIAFLLAAKRP